MLNRFKTYAALIIDNIEGGYYHPNMKSALKNGDKMGNSGETMYGMDRAAGGDDVNNSTAGKKFWKIIDDNDAANKWNYNYKPTGSIAQQLKDLAAEMMYNRYVKYCNSYLSNNQNIISKDTRLELHFFYACWNGSGWFKQFATKFNEELAAQKSTGKIDYDKLVECVYNSRHNSSNSLIKSSGDKIKNIWSLATFKKIKVGNKTWLWLSIGALIIGGSIIIYKHKKVTKR